MINDRGTHKAGRLNIKKSLGPRIIIQPNPVLIVGCYDQSDRPNIVAVAWGNLLLQTAVRCHIAQAVNIQR
jgi:hypothetical protein